MDRDKEVLIALYSLREITTNLSKVVDETSTRLHGLERDSTRAHEQLKTHWNSLERIEGALFHEEGSIRTKIALLEQGNNHDHSSASTLLQVRTEDKKSQTLIWVALIGSLSSVVVVILQAVL